MKKIKFLLIAVALFVAGSTFAQSPLFQGIPSGEGVEKVYISKAMLKMAGNMVSGNMGGVNMNAVKDLNGVEVVTVENRKYFSAVETTLKAFLEKNNMEVLLTSDDGEDKTTIYGLPDESGMQMKNMIIYNIEPDEVNVVVIWGNIDPAAVMSK